ncbi:unnamed protein product [Adineta ricciae]|uniref:cyclin-dependent kinase n=1 Tax=Adineta ricciae TaxID=249248 RepID=A0A814TIA5_ADIRI|nr:unnamed protein product [Adineta ricciae]
MKHIPANVKNKYEILGKIGEGSYGVVLKARKKDTNTIVAIKHFKQAPAGNCSDMDIIERELKVLQSLRFEHVVELLEWFRHKKQCFLVFEYVEWNMLQVLQEHPDGLALDRVRQLSYQLFSAIHWCHTHEIIHRDIKPENLLISKTFSLKLCDFGFARFCNTQTTADFYTDYVATRWYRSPELLIGSPYGKPVDIWACGCIIAELATGQALFAGESDIDQLYRIQKCLGPLPAKYVEAMKSNPKFDGLKFPTIQHLNTLERQFGHIFPLDLMSVFEGTLRLYAPERLTSGACVQHIAFTHFNQKQPVRRSRQQRPKTVVGIVDMHRTQYDNNNNNPDLVSFNLPYGDSRMSRWRDDTSDIQPRHRSPTSSINNGIDSTTEISVTVPSSLILQPNKCRSNTQLSDRAPASQQQQSKTDLTSTSPRSSLSEDRVQPFPVNLTSSNDSSDDDDISNVLSNNNRLRRKYVKAPQEPSLSLLLNQSQTVPEQSQPVPLSSSTLKGVLLRPKQQQPQKQPARVFQTSSKDVGKRLKRFTTDTTENRWHQQMPESNVHRSSMAIVPSLNTNAYGIPVNNNSSHNLSTIKLSQQKDDFHSDVQPRSKSRDLIRSRTVECHPPLETMSNLQRAPSRQTVVSNYQIGSDIMDQTDIETTISATHPYARPIDQPQQLNINKYSCAPESRKSLYASDSHLINTNTYGSCFSRPYHHPTKGDFAHISKILLGPQRDSSYDLIKTSKALIKQTKTTFPKPSIETNRRQQSSSNLFGVYPYTRTGVRHAQDTAITTSFQRQQSIRLPSTKSRLHDR